MSASSISLSPQHPHSFASSLSYSKPTKVIHDSLQADILAIQSKTPQFSLQNEIFAKHGLKLEPSSSLAYFQNPTAFSKVISLYRFPQSLGEVHARQQEIPIAPEHFQKLIKIADTLLPVVKRKLENSTDDQKGNLVRKIGNFDLAETQKNPMAFFFPNPANKKSVKTGPYTNGELGAAVRNLMEFPKALKNMIAPLMSSMLPFLAQNDPKAYQELMSMAKQSKLWTLKDSTGNLLGTVSHAPAKDVLKAYTAEKTEQNAAHLEGHGFSSILLKPQMDAKHDVEKALLDNLIDQARKAGQKHLWVYLPQTGSLTQQVKTRHAGTPVSVEDAQKALPFFKPEIIQSALSAYNLANLKLFHIKL
jgi:hypothetical protein